MNKKISPRSALLLLAMLTTVTGCIYTGGNMPRSVQNVPPKPRSDQKIPTKPLPDVAATECTTQEYSAEELFENSKDSIAVVYTGSGSGSAFIIHQSNNSIYLATNAHVVEGNNIVSVKWIDGTQNKARVIKIGNSQNPINDLAILQVKGKTGKPLNINNINVRTGADVIALGAPQGLEFTITKGIVSAVRANGSIIQVDAPINPGNSGGPILDKTGCVVGVSTFIREDSEGLNFGISSTQLQEFIASETESKRRNGDTAPKISPSKSQYPQTCWTSAHPEAPKGKLISLGCKVSNPKPGLVIVEWSDGYSTKFRNYSDRPDEIEDTASGTIKYGTIDDELLEKDGKQYVIVNADDGAESWIPIDKFQN